MVGRVKTNRYALASQNTAHARLTYVSPIKNIARAMGAGDADN